MVNVCVMYDDDDDDDDDNVMVAAAAALLAVRYDLVSYVAGY